LILAAACKPMQSLILEVRFHCTFNSGCYPIFMRNALFVIQLEKTPREIKGPLESSAVIESLRSGVFSWSDIGFIAETDGVWKRLYELDFLRVAMPDLPPLEKLTRYTKLCEDHLQQGGKTPASSGKAQSQSDVVSSLNSGTGAPTPVSPVYLQVSGSEYGPMSVEEMKKILEKRTFKNQVYAWYKGLKTWFPVQEISGFTHLTFEESQMKSDSHQLLERLVYSREARTSKRKEIVATVRQIQKGALPKNMPFGVCVNISDTGVQVLLEEPCKLLPDQNYNFELLPLTIYGMPTLFFQGRVIWVKDGGVRVGVSFNSFERNGLDKLAEYLSKVEYQSVTDTLGRY
jgi:hypothetical protein